MKKQSEFGETDQVKKLDHFTINDATYVSYGTWDSP